MDNAVQRYLVPGIIVLSSTVALLILRSITFRVLHQWAKRTETQLDDIIIKSIKNPSLLFAIAIGIHIGLTFSEISYLHRKSINTVTSSYRRAIEKMRSMIGEKHD